jgi:hypothetical protein
MQRLRWALSHGRDDGAVLVWVVLLVTALFGFATIAVDAAVLYQEHRELQNGADAAVLAVAVDCANGSTVAACGAGLGTADATAEHYADANAEDNSAEATVDLSAYAAKKITVTASSIEAGTAPGQIGLFFARAIGFDTGETTATAVAKWGPPKLGSIGTLPLTMSLCEYDDFLARGAGYAEPPWDTDNAAPWDSPNGAPQVIYFHSTQDPDGTSGGGGGGGKGGGGGSPPPPPTAADCDAQAGQDTDGDGRLPGGFGWLDVSSTVPCAAVITGNTAEEDPGSSPDHNDCPPSYLESNVLYHTIFVPVFLDVNGLGGNNGVYTFVTYAAFYVNGYNFGGGYKKGFNCQGSGPQSGSSRCLSGWFTTDIPSGGSVGTGPDFGVRVVGLDG